MNAKWLVVTSEENWQKCVKYGVWATDDNRLSQIKRIQGGDYLVVYIKKMKLAGIYKVTREYFYDNTQIWKDGIYPHRIGISPLKIPTQFIDIKESYDTIIRPKLLAKGDNSGTAGGYFGQAIRPLPEDEFSVFESEINKNLRYNTNSTEETLERYTNKTNDDSISTKEILDEPIDTDSLCNQLQSSINPVQYLQTLEENTIERWTKALGPLRAKLSSESYDYWKLNLDIDTLTEIYQFINEKEQELESIIIPQQKAARVHNLSITSSIIMCGIRQLQHKFGVRANMNAHKYTVIKKQFPNVMTEKRISKDEYNTITSANDISQSKNNLLSFIDLQKFLLEEMRMQANYQPIMIRTLLESGGQATKDDIAVKIEELNAGSQEANFNNIPVYNVLEKNGIVRKQNNGKFILNSVELSEGQRQQLIALCNWKIDNMPLQLEELIEAFDKNKTLFGQRRLSSEEAERMRSAFVSDFAMEKIPTLELDDYVIGKPDSQTGGDGVNKTTFCYRLFHELGVALSGFGVKNALDFGIYYSKENQKVCI